MIETSDYCKARPGQDIKKLCDEFAKFDCQGCPCFDEEQYDMDEYEERCIYD